MTSRRISMPHFYAPGRSYFDRAVLPLLKATQDLVTPTVLKMQIADKHVHIYMYGDAGLKVFPLAFTHQRPSTADRADLVIHAWDATPTGTDPIPPWDDPSYQQADFDDTFYSAYVQGEESLSFYDTQTNTGYFWMHDASQLSDWSTGAPFRAILHWFLGTHNIHLLHGAVVGLDNQSVLLTAKSGSGKSTTALSSLLADMEYVGDDYVAVQSDDAPTSPVVAHSLYNSAKITRSGLELFPELQPLVWNKHFSGNEKAVVFASHLVPHQIKTSSVLKAVFIPRITGGQTRITPANKVQVLIALAPTTLLQLPLAKTDTLSVLKKITEKVPCYFIDLGPDIRAIPEVIKSYLKDNLV